MGWLRRWLGGRRASTPSPTDDFWYDAPFRTGVHSGVKVTADLALTASAVFACVKVLAETIATLPLAMHRELPGGGREPAPEHPLDELIRFAPNPTTTAVEFWELMVLHAAVRGTGYAEIVPGARGAVDQLLPLHKDRVRAERLADGSLRFQVTDPRTGARRTLLQEEVLRVPGLSSNGVEGLRVVDLAAEAIGLGLAADGYAARVFRNALNIGGYLEHPGKLSEAAQKNLLQAFIEKLAGIENAHRPVVLQEGMQFKAGTMTAKDAQLLEAREWQIREICRFWRIPPHMVGVTGSQPRANVEQEALEFVKYTLRPWVRRIEQAIRRDLIVRKDRFVAKFNMEGLLRGDSAARATYLSKALGAGGSPAWLTQNEARMIEGLNRINDPRADALGVGTNPDTSGAAAFAEAVPGAPWTARLAGPASAINGHGGADGRERVEG